MFSNCTINLNGLTRRLSDDRSEMTLIPCSRWPDAEAFGQRQSEDESSQDTQHRSSPANEESGSQFKPVCQRIEVRSQRCPPFVLFYSFFFRFFFFCFFYWKNLLLSNKERVEEVGGNSVSVNGARGHATQACRQKISIIWGFALEIWKSTCTFVSRQIRVLHATSHQISQQKLVGMAALFPFSPI